MEKKITVTEVTGNEKPVEQVEVVEQIVVPAPEPVELKDEQLFEALSKKLNKPIASFDDLKEKEIIKEELPEDVATFFKYKKETGRGVEDFVKINRDYKALDPDQKLFEYLSSKEEGLDKEDILAMMEEFKPEVIDEDLDLEEDIARKKSANSKKKLALKKTLNEADKFFDNLKETYKVPLVSSPAPIPDEDKELYESFKQHIQTAKSAEEANVKKAEWFEQKTNELFSKDFKGFEVKVKLGEEEKAYTFAPGDADELKSRQSTPLNFINKFMDENGMMKDAAGYHKGLAFAMNPDKVAQFFYEQGIADAKESDDKRIKNINMSVRQSPTPIANGQVKVQEVGPPNLNTGTKQTFGSRLTVKKA